MGNRNEQMIEAVEKIADHSFHHLTLAEVNEIGEALRDAAEAVASHSGTSRALRFLTEMMMHARVRSADAFRELEQERAA